MLPTMSSLADGFAIANDPVFLALSVPAPDRLLWLALCGIALALVMVPLIALSERRSDAGAVCHGH